MTRIIQCGFETGDTNQEGSDSSSTSPVNTAVLIVSATPTPRSGGYCLKASSANAASSGFSARKRFAHGNLTEVWYAFGLFSHLVSEPVNGNFFFRALNSEGWVNIALMWDAGVIRAYSVAGSYNANTSSSGFNNIGSSSAAYSGDAWHLIEIRYIPHMTAGTLQVYVDGALAIDVSGVRTVNNSATVISTSEFDLGFHRCPNVIASGNAGSYMAFDDLRVNNTAGSVNNGKPGDGKIIALVPNGAGTYTQLTPSAGANWQCVDEIPPSTADFVSHASIGNKDTYAFTDPTVVGNIQAVAEIAMAQNTGGGGSIGFMVRSGGVDNEAAPTAITASWTYYRRIMEIDPTDSAVWTTAKLTALEAGVVVR